MILRRIEIALTGPDEWPEDEDDYEQFHRQERMAMFLFADHMHIVVRQIQSELPDEYDIEVAG